MPSATKTKRREADFYETPEWCTRALLDSYPIDPKSTIVECCAGHGAISRVLKEYYPQCNLIQYELNKNKKLKKYGHVIWGDFLENCVYSEEVNYVITNPPFTLSLEFITKCRENYPNAEIIMLLPFSFLGSAKRHDWWLENIPNKFSVLSDRPSFTNNSKTDSSTYSWIHWFNMYRNNIQLPMSFLSRNKEC